MAKKAAQSQTSNTAAHPLAPFNEAKIQSLLLRDLRLLTSSSFLNPDIHPQDLPKSVNQEIKVHCARSEPESALIYMIDFSLKSSLENGDLALKVSVRFGLIFQFESLGAIDENAAQVFGQTTGLFCIWPYWREFVQNMVARMGLPPIRIPLMRPGDMQFSATPKEKHEFAEKAKPSGGRKRRR